MCNQLADIFTKSLPTHSFTSLRFKLGVDVPPTSSLRGDISQKQASPTASRNDTVSESKSDKPKPIQAHSANIQKSSPTALSLEDKTKAWVEKRKGKMIATCGTEKKKCGPALHNAFAALDSLEDTR